jgi:hypothetical protein
MSTPNVDGFPVTRQSETAKAETGAKLSTAAIANKRMPVSCEYEVAFRQLKSRHWDCH